MVRRIAALVVMVLVLASPDPVHGRVDPGAGPGPAPAPAPEATDVTTAVLTPEGFDQYRYGVERGSLRVQAPGSNGGGDLRMLWWAPTSPTAVDQASCSTWTELGGPAVQAGVALRVREVPGGVQAITVTNNIWVGARSAWNVHLWKPGPDRLGPRIGQAILPDTFGATPQEAPPLPWRICARAVGPTVEFKAWSLGAGEPEPAWGDPDHGRRFPLPPEWVYEGRPGWYVGHLGPGQATTLQALASDPLERCAGLRIGRHVQDRGIATGWVAAAAAGVPPA